MPSVALRRESEIVRTPRVMQLESLFDVPVEARSVVNWTVEMSLPEDWNIGIIVGPSGAGKTTVARELFGEHIPRQHEWDQKKSVVDGFPKNMSIKEVVELLSSVGFSSPPAWLRPFAVLSTGEQFRVSVALALAETKGLTVIDEFTSVVDRTVAQIGSAAVARTVRGRNTKLIAVSCHYDIIDWLDPDWIYEPHINRLTRRSLQGRPSIVCEISRVDRDAWRIFGQHHYLSRSIESSAHFWMGTIDKKPACFTAIMSFPHATMPGWRFHRLVCLPDFQGVGLGTRFRDYIASMYAALDKPVMVAAAHPAVVAHCSRSNQWVMVRSPQLGAMKRGRTSGLTWQFGAGRRNIAGFRYCGPVRADEARKFGLPVPAQITGKAQHALRSKATRRGGNRT